jgi:hypothetical protein
MNTSTKALGIGISGVLAISAIAPTAAAPVFCNTAAIKSATSDHITDVRWRAGPAIAAGAIAGIALGAAIASQPRYYGPGYYAPPPAYYGPPPAYYYPPPAAAYDPYYYDYPQSRTQYFQGRVDTNGAGYSW